MVDVFISYTRDERSRCVSIAERLQALGLDVWFDAKLTSGVSFDREIEEKLRAAKAVLVLWSPKSVQSNWVRNEATIGQQRDVLVSVEIAPCQLPIAFTNTHTERLHKAPSDDDPAWMNILARLSGLTGHPALAKYRGLQPQTVRRRSGAAPALVGLGALVVAAAAGAGAWMMFGGPPGAEAERPAEAAPALTAEFVAAPAESAPPVLAPEVAGLAATLVGQWSIKRSNCPAKESGQPVDMTPSTGAWFTVQLADDGLQTTSAGRTSVERIVGLQNGWLRTVSGGLDLYYQLNESGRLMLRVGDGEAVKMEPCL